MFKQNVINEISKYNLNIQFFFHLKNYSTKLQI